MRYILLILFSVIFVSDVRAEPNVCKAFEKTCFSQKIAIMSTKIAMKRLNYGACLSWEKSDCKKEYNDYVKGMNQEMFANCEECFGEASSFKDCTKFTKKVCFPKIPLAD